MKFAQLVIGPAGSGKSTYCDTIQQHGRACRRMMHAMNLGAATARCWIKIIPALKCHLWSPRINNNLLPMFCLLADPAAENFTYEASCDIRDLITIDDVMEECNLGPNGYALSHGCVCFAHRVAGSCKSPSCKTESCQQGHNREMYGVNIGLQLHPWMFVSYFSQDGACVGEHWLTFVGYE
jgi:hypothetical protein